MEGVPIKNIERVVDEVKSAVGEIDSRYKIHIFPGIYPPSSIVVGIAGPKEEKIKAIDLKIMAKIFEICERRNIDYHIFKPLRMS